MSNAKHWQELALNDLRTTNMTMSEIALKYGRSERTVEKLKYQHKVVRTLATRRGLKKREELLPMSRTHHAIGIRLSMARAGQTPSAFSTQLGISIPTLVGMEHGHYDFRLSQLQKICETTGLDLLDLMQTFDKNVYQRSTNARQ